MTNELADLLLDVAGREMRVDLLPELPQQRCVGECTVAGARGQAVARNEVVKPMVAVFREQSPRQLDRAQHLRPDVEPGATKGRAQVAMVEACVVRDEEPSIQAVEDFVGHFGEGGRIGHHVIVDAGQALDVIRDARGWTNQRRPLAHAVLVDLDDADLGDRRALCGAAIGFDIDEGKAAGGEARNGEQGC